MKTGDIILFSKSKKSFIRKLVHKDFIDKNNSVLINYIFDNCGLVAIIEGKPYVLIAGKKLKKILLDENFVAKYDYEILTYVEDIDNKTRKNIVLDYARCDGVDLINKLPLWLIKILYFIGIVDMNNIYDYLIEYLSKIFKRHGLNIFTGESYNDYVELFNLTKFKIIDFNEK